MGIELAPLTMPLAGSRRPWTFPGLETSFHGLPGILADALPDKFGNRLIDQWMAVRGVAPDSITPLDRLAYMGKRGMGALEFRPPMTAARESSRSLDMQTLVEEVRLAFQGDLATQASSRNALAGIIRVGTSAGGARPKAVIAWNPATNEIRSGQFDAASGFEHWLLKFDGVGTDLDLGTSRAYGRIEYAYHLMARRAGIEMAPCRLLEENGRAHFMTRRFDRAGNAKHHIQSLCGLRHLDYNARGSHSYEQWFLTIRQLGLGDSALEQAFRRMAFNVMARNCDDHTKNIAFRLRRGSSWELAPAFDVTHAYSPSSPWVSQHLMSVNGKFSAIAAADLLTISDRHAIAGGRRLLEEVRSSVQSWREFAAAAGVPKPETAQIERDFEPV